ncbi:MAG TPA: hypothetical protein VEK08_26945 [Planctomycetota bacterium]|nr:hypothetical protein [Planctomycetota bacterium]
MKISISICPTNLEVGSDVMDEYKYLARIEEVVTEAYPDAKITCQVGHRQGDEWFKIDGKSSEELYELVQGIDCSDESLYAAK